MHNIQNLPWYQSSTLYHIYPLSFADSDGDGYGDLQGVIKHLDYLNDGTADSLGIGAIWLSPLYLSGMADWGYDVVNHTSIDPQFGSMQDFEQLVREVHRRGMKLLMDYVPNHTSSEHSWFGESRSSRTNPRRDWYVWADPKPDGSPPNNWLSHFGGPAWTYEESTGQYYLHTFLPQQPDLNWRNPQVRSAMLDVLSFWLSKGVDGFRTDAVTGLVKDVLLRDDISNPDYREGVSNPAHKYLRVHSSGQADLKDVLGSFCEVVSRKAGAYILSEAYLDIPGLQALYAACKDHPVHAPFNFNLMSLDWSASLYRGFIDEYEASMGPDDWPNYVLGNHDRHRLVSRVGEERARMLAVLQLTLRGLPVVYYGDELGLPDGKLTTSDLRDPLELRLPGYHLGRDPARTPMPWSDESGSGFTTGKPWLPLHQRFHSLNAARQSRQPESFLSLYRHLIALRNLSPALAIGDYHALSLKNGQIFGYIREVEGQRFTVVLNFSSQPQVVSLQGKVGAWIAGTHEVEGDGVIQQAGEIKLQAYEGRVYELRRGGATT